MNHSAKLLLGEDRLFSHFTNFGHEFHVISHGKDREI